MAHSFEPLISSMASAKRMAGTAQAPRLQALANFQLYLCLFYRDLQYMFCDTLIERDPLKRNLQARHLAVALHDFFERAHTAIDKGIRQEIEQSSYPEAIKMELRALGKALTKLRETHQSKLKLIRNTAAAHRDLDALTQLAAISQVDVDLVLEITQDVSNTCSTLFYAWKLAISSHNARRE